MAATMQGFDAEFRDLDHYIRAITERIWEGRRIDDIRRYYADDCAVETPASVSLGVQAVIDGTRATLLAFPDRRLLAEDVIVSGDAQHGYLSSHRIFSPMTHAGAGAFGAATGRPVYARTIADCVCINNRIVHEWLVRDQAAIARHIGSHEREVAQRWLNERGGFAKAAMPAAPAPYRSHIDTGALAQAYGDALRALWRGEGTRASARLYDAHAITALPGGEVATDSAGRQAFWAGLLGALQPQQLSIEHLVAAPRGDHVTRLAMRWRARMLHVSDGRYGHASGKTVELLGISHAEVEAGRVHREWLLLDDVAIWMQVLDVQG
jgi:predicted ester cyclase